MLGILHITVTLLLIHTTYAIFYYIQLYTLMIIPYLTKIDVLNPSRRMLQFEDNVVGPVSALDKHPIHHITISKGDGTVC